MNSATATEALRRYIEEFHLESTDEIDVDAPLLEWGVIDSFAIADLLTFIEERFGFSVPVEEITPENLRSVRSIADLLSRLDSSSGGP